MTGTDADLPWREMARMRDVLMHHYFGTDLDIVWNVVVGELPKVEEALPALIATIIALDDRASADSEGGQP